MFYSQFLLSRNGPLGVIWFAAHLESKLRKKHITNIDIAESVDKILYSDMPIALRISGHLLVGVVRIFARKVEYLFHDCSETLLKIHHGFEMSSAINLPPTALVAPYHAITMPETFDFDELGIHINPDNATPACPSTEFDHHVTPRDLITLQEPLEDGFTVQSPYNMPGFSTEEFFPEMGQQALTEEVQNQPATDEEVLPPLPLEENMDLDYEEFERKSLEERVVEESKVVTSSHQPGTVEDIETLRAKSRVSEQHRHFEFEEVNISEDGVETVPITQKTSLEIGEVDLMTDVMEEHLVTEKASPVRTEQVSPLLTRDTTAEVDILGSILGARARVDTIPSHVTSKPSKRKRKLVYDVSTTIPSVSMRKQLCNTREICRPRRKAPSTEYEIWVSQIENKLERRILGPTLPVMSNKLKDFFKIIAITKTDHNEPGTPDRTRGTEHIKPDISGDVSTRDKQEHLDNILQDITMREIPEQLEDSMSHDIGRGEHLEKTMEVYLTDVEDALEGGGRECFQEITDFSRVKRRIHFRAVNTSIMIPLNEQETLQEERRSEYDEVDIQVLARRDEIGVEDSMERSKIEDIAVVIDLESPRKPLEVHDHGIPFHAEETLPKCEPLREVSQLSQDLSSQLGHDFLLGTKETGTTSNGEPHEATLAEIELMGKALEDKTGWASRTSAVAGFLKQKFQSIEAGRVLSLNLEVLLHGRRRKEAACMFFETLVLASVGYIRVEQESGCSAIYILPTDNLMGTVC